MVTSGFSESLGLLWIQICIIWTKPKPGWIPGHKIGGQITVSLVFAKATQLLVALFWHCCIKYLVLKVWILFHHNSGSGHWIFIRINWKGFIQWPRPGYQTNEIILSGGGPWAKWFLKPPPSVIIMHSLWSKVFSGWNAKIVTAKTLLCWSSKQEKFQGTRLKNEGSIHVYLGF